MIYDDTPCEILKEPGNKDSLVVVEVLVRVAGMAFNFALFATSLQGGCGRVLALP